MNNSVVDIAIIGAGPYGLSIASHLKADGIPFRIFGSPMRFWQEMPKGISLKSFDFATNIYSPVPNHSFKDYCKERLIDSDQPVDVAVFAEYGLWAQRELVPEVEDVQVRHLTSQNGLFRLSLSNGEQVLSRCVVVAVGLGYFERLPDVIRQLPITLRSHTASNRDYSRFSGKDVTVIGGGQSALEAAALLYEHGAATRLIVRGNGVWFSDKMAERRSIKERLRNPQSVVGPGRDNWVLEHFPSLMHYLPERRRVRFTRRHLGPFGTWWLRDKIEGKVPVHTRAEIVQASEAEGRIRLTVRDDAGERQFDTDHIVAGTGFEADLDRISFIDPALAARVARVERAPKLSSTFESSVPGLYFVGPVAAFSFGPLVRFVCGAAFAAPTVARHLKRKRRSRSTVNLEKPLRVSAFINGDPVPQIKVDDSR